MTTFFIQQVLSHGFLFLLIAAPLYWFNSFTQSCLTLCDPHGLQHTRLPCPSPSPRACSNSCPLSRWCHPTISSSIVPFSLCLNLSQHQGLFQGVSSSHQVAKVLRVSASASVLPVDIQDWFPLGWTCLILQSKRLSRVFSNTTVQNYQFFGAQLSLRSIAHIHTQPLEKP